MRLVVVGCSFANRAPSRATVVVVRLFTTKSRAASMYCGRVASSLSSEFCTGRPTIAKSAPSLTNNEAILLTCASSRTEAL